MADTPLSLHEARAIARRGIEKAEELNQSGAFVVVDRFGVIVTASRMDDARTMSYRISRAKAHLAAVQYHGTGEVYDMMMAVPKILLDQINALVSEPIFHGQGSQLIEKDGRIVGAVSTGAGIPPWVKFPGVDSSKLIADGKAANGEDLVVSYALDKPYAPQHGDDEPKWIKAYGEPPMGKGTAMDKAPEAAKQRELDAAIKLSDAAMAEAERRNVLISVVIVSEGGEVVQLDRMDGAAPMTPDAAISLAVTALNFQGSSALAADYPDLQGLGAATRLKFLAVPGGLPLVRNGRVCGGLGVSGTDPKACAEIAAIAMKAEGWEGRHV